MDRTTLLRRNLLIGGLVAPVLTPIMNVHAQGSLTPPQTKRAPFGLTWGMNADSVRRLGMDDFRVNGCRDDCGPDGHAYYSYRMPNTPPDTQVVWMYFGQKDRLFRLTASSKDLDGSLRGGAALARYRELSLLLTDTYGKGDETEPASAPWFGRQDNAKRFTTFQTAEVNITLELAVVGLLAPVWIIYYEHRAEAAAAKADYGQRSRGLL